MARLIVSAAGGSRPGQQGGGFTVSVSDVASGEPVSGLGPFNIEMWFGPSKFNITQMNENRPGFYDMNIQLPNFVWDYVGIYAIEVIVKRWHLVQFGILKIPYSVDKGQVVANFFVVPSNPW
jgi:hypothetical protein